MYQENYEKVRQMEQRRALIWPANEQLDEMGKLDLHKNKTIWNTALNGLKTIPLWEAGAPNYDDRDPDQLLAAGADFLVDSFAELQEKMGI